MKQTINIILISKDSVKLRNPTWGEHVSDLPIFLPSIVLPLFLLTDM